MRCEAIRAEDHQYLINSSNIIQEVAPADDQAKRLAYDVRTDLLNAKMWQGAHGGKTASHDFTFDFKGYAERRRNTIENAPEYNETIPLALRFSIKRDVG
jgi:hypothetical protein